MKSKIENRGLRHGARLNQVILFVALLWLATSVLLLVLYRPGAEHAVQPETARQPLALERTQAARASLMY